jgi:hypothetical protein
VLIGIPVIVDVIIEIVGIGEKQIISGENEGTADMNAWQMEIGGSLALNHFPGLIS